MGFFQKIKKWLSGGGKQQTSKKTVVKAPKKQKDGASYEISPRGNVGTTVAYRRAAAKKEEEKKQKQRQTQQKEKVSQAFKSGPVDEKVRIGQERKQTSDVKKALDKGRREAFAAALKPQIDKKYDPSTKEGKQRIKMGLKADDPMQAMYETAKNPVATSAARGALSGVTFGASDLIAAKATRGEARKAEEYYQREKSRGAELAGELAGTLVGFGLTGGASAAGTKALAKKLAPRAFEKGTEKAIARAASSKLIRKAAQKEALKRFGIDGATEEVIEQIAKRRAVRVVEELGRDAAINITTGLAMDVNNALVDSENWQEFAKNMGLNAAINVAVGGVTSFAPGVISNSPLPEMGREVADDAVRKLSDTRGAVDLGDDVERGLKDLADEADEAVTPPRKKAKNALTDKKKRMQGVESTVKAEDIKPLEKAKPEPKTKSKGKVKTMKDVVEEKTGKTLDELKEDISTSKKLESGFKTAEPETNAKENVNAVRDAVEERTGKTLDDIEKEVNTSKKLEKEFETKTENAGAGEKTTFNRSDEKTAKEKAREKRAEGNKQKATQETFDKDYESFRKKVAENQAKASDLKEQIRAAKTPEEKAALKEQLDALNSEIKREYNKASMRYHPDRGGSNEWMGKFNSAYDDYRKGSYKSRGFQGAESSRRTRAGSGTESSWRERAKAKERTASAGGGGNTPPPRKGASASGEKGFRKPMGKARKGEQRVVYKGQDVVGKRAEKTTARENAVKAGGSVRMTAVDSHAPFEDIARTFRKIPEKMQDLYGLIDKHRRAGGISTRSIGNRQVNYKGRKYSGTVKRVGADGKEYAIENGKSLKDIYKGMDKETEADFDYFLLLRHAPDRAKEGTPIFKDVVTTDGLDLGTDPKAWESEAKKMLEKHPEFAQKAEEVYQYLENELHNLVDAGLVSEETATKWAKDHPFYVPTHRMGETGSGMTTSVGGSIGATDIKAAKGSDKDIRSIRDQIEEATRRNWEDITLNDMLDGFFGDKISKKIAGELEGGFDLAIENNISVAKSLDGKKFYAIIRRGGEKYRVEIDKKYVDALKDWNKNGKFGNTAVDTVNEGLSKFTKVWKGLITEWSPVFMLKNPMRDIPEAFINSRQSKLFAKNLPAAFKDIANGGPYSEALRDAGISQSSFFELDKAIREDIDAARRGPLSKGAHAVLDKIEAGNQFMEMLPRLAEFMATIEKAGKTIETADKALLDRAAANAADVTVNFGRSGSIGKGLNKGFVPFFNPSVQGWSKFARNLTEQPGAKAYLSLAAKMGALGAGVTVVNNYMLKDNPNYQQISARDKANNIIIPYPLTEADKTDTFIRIPQSRFASVLSLPGVNAFNENKMGWADAIKIANDQVAPVNPIESHFAAPLFATAKNKSWYGTPIVPKALEDLPKSEQTDVNTSDIATALGKATEKLPRKMQISPKKADYVIDAETGIIGDIILPATTPSRQGGGKGLKKYGPAALGAVTKPFTIDSTVQNDLSTRFYDKLNEANTSTKSKYGGEKEAAEYKRLNSYSSEIAGINAAIKELQGGGKATKQEDIRNLQKVRNGLMQDALDGKGVPSKTKTMDAVQKSVGTTYAVNNFGSTADKEAMEIYGRDVYGDISEKQMKKKMDADKDFYKGVQSIGKLNDSIKKAGLKGGSTTLGKAVALASINAKDEMFGAYGTTVQSRVETASKADRAKAYFEEGGSMKEYIKLEKNRKNVGKMPKDESAKEIDKLEKQHARGEITSEEYKQKKAAVEYNGNISYVGHAVSLALANSPRRGYKVYDIKDKNIQKGKNLAAMGFTSRDYRQMAKDLDANGNGYPSRQEVIDYVANSDVKDKATLFDALYYYKGSNPFGTPKEYSRAKAANVGKSKKVEWIVDDKDEFEVNPEESGSGYGYRRYGRRWRRWGRRGGGSSKAELPQLRTDAAFKAKAPAAKTRSKAVRAKGESQLAEALEELKRTEVKVKPPTPKGAK